MQLWMISTLTVTGNTITNCNRGMDLAFQDSNPMNASIHENVISGSTEYGIKTWAGDFSTGPAVTSVDATRNWWGAADGPSGDASGSGDAIYGAIDYAPWYTDVNLTTLGGDGTFQGMINAAIAGSTIQIPSGTYSETIEIGDGNLVDGITLTGDPSDMPVITGGVHTSNSSAISGWTFENMIIRGTAPGQGAVFEMDNGGACSNLSLVNVTIDGEGQNVHGFLGQGLTGTFSVIDCTIENIGNWAAFDTDSGGGIGDDGLEALVFTGNTIRNNDGAVALRGAAQPRGVARRRVLGRHQIASTNP